MTEKAVIIDPEDYENRDQLKKVNLTRGATLQLDEIDFYVSNHQDNCISDVKTEQLMKEIFSIADFY